jgi:hypothetical protein
MDVDSYHGNPAKQIKEAQFLELLVTSPLLAVVIVRNFRRGAHGSRRRRFGRRGASALLETVPAVLVYVLAIRRDPALRKASD